MSAEAKPKAELDAKNQAAFNLDKARQDVVQSEKELATIKLALKTLATTAAAASSPEGGDDAANDENKFTVSALKITGLPESATPKLSLQLSSPVESLLITKLQDPLNPKPDDSDGSYATFRGVDTEVATLTLSVADADIPLGSSALYDVGPLCEIDVIGGVTKKVTHLEVAIVPDAESGQLKIKEQDKDIFVSCKELLPEGEEEESEEDSFEDAIDPSVEEAAKDMKEGSTEEAEKEEATEEAKEEEATEEAEKEEATEEAGKEEATEEAEKEESTEEVGEEEATGEEVVVETGADEKENETEAEAEKTEEADKEKDTETAAKEGAEAPAVSEETEENVKEEETEKADEPSNELSSSEEQPAAEKEGESESATKPEEEPAAESLLVPTCVVQLKIEYEASTKDQKHILDSLSSKALARKAMAITSLRKEAAAFNRAKTAASASSDSSALTTRDAKSNPAVKAGFLNKKPKVKEPMFLIRWYQKTFGPKSMLMKVYPIAKNYVLFFGGVLLMHYQGQQLALPPPV